MARKKKAVEVEVKPVTYTFTEQQFERLNQIITWDNPIDDVKSIKDMGDASLLEIGYAIGELHTKFEKALNDAKDILNEVDPEGGEDESDVEEFDNYEEDDEN